MFHALAWAGTLLIAMYVCVRMLSLRSVVYSTTVLTLVLVVLGAYVRLTDAGLGCPDWPGCYGKLSPFHALEEISAAEEMSPAGPVSTPKAWKEMAHRYIASLVGAMILSIVVGVFLHRRRTRPDPGDPARAAGLPLLLLAFVVLQGLFGKWTVTLLLKPVIVTLHLIGGMLILGMLSWLSCRFLGLPTSQRPAQARSLRPWAMLGLLLLLAQIALGGWVSTNYAALACTDFPTCHGRWVPGMDFSSAFQLQRELGLTVDGQALSNAALNAIHWSHRAGAMIVLAVLGVIAYLTAHVNGLRHYGVVLMLLLVIQVALGITNVLAMLPLPVAVAHNAGAALLLMLMVMLNFALRKGSIR
jgi:cytochrome c oxidase assembly protein subunit 15